MTTQQQSILETFITKGSLTMDDCAFFMHSFTCRIEESFYALNDDGHIQVWVEGEDEHDTVYSITPKGRAAWLAEGKGVAA
jgi:hypothetical protein